MAFVRVGPEDFDVSLETTALLQTAGDVGAVSSFLGLVRSGHESPVVAMSLEHYPGMTQKVIAAKVAEAEFRFRLSACRVIHRTGRIGAGGQIVLVLAAACHRQASLDAVAFLIDRLKVAAPFWKKEHLADGSNRWVEAFASDDCAAARWNVA